MKKFITLPFVLWVMYSIHFPYSGSGSGTSGDPYLVASASQLNKVRNDLTAYYKQTADIDISGYSNRTKIGTSTSSYFSGNSNSHRSYLFTEATPPSSIVQYRLKQIDNDDGPFKYSQSVEIEVGVTAKELTLLLNYPNPFNPVTTIEFTVPQDGHATLGIYNIVGRLVEILFDGDVKAGYVQKAFFDALKLASGVYFSQL